MNTSSMIANAISVLVAFVPEGLPLALSMGLTLVARRLCVIHHVLVKQMSTIGKGTWNPSVISLFV